MCTQSMLLPKRWLARTFGVAITFAKGRSWLMPWLPYKVIGAIYGFRFHVCNKFVPCLSFLACALTSHVTYP